MNCHWVKDKDVPGGRFLVPGCWNRAINGDDAECHCKMPTRQEQFEEINSRLDKLEKLITERLR